MNKIEFKNFRKFAEFKPLEYGGITFLVGRNNAGKSTMVKALLLMIDYLKSDNVKRFSFNQNNIEDVNIVTFERALNRLANEKKDDSIFFSLTIDDFQFDLTITGLKNSTEVQVINLEIESLSNGFKFIIKPNEGSVTISSINKVVETIPTDNNLLLELASKRNELTHQLKDFEGKSNPQFISLNEELKSVRKKIKDLNNSLKLNNSSGSFSLQTYFHYNSLGDILLESIDDNFLEYQTQYHEIQKGKAPKKIFEQFKAFKDYKFKIDQTLSNLFGIQSGLENIYLGASLSKQSALFAIRDNKNALAQAIHEFMQLGIYTNTSSQAYRFVKEWMAYDKFSIGDAFSIKMFAGEAYEVKINSNGKEIHLADKGMGSIQAMLLIIRLATVLHKWNLYKKNYTVIIEEPELNLHPALQSKLADLFLDVYLKSNESINFVIETHSEYLIRKSQLLVKENEFEIAPNENPFTVLYFDDTKGPYKMNYREDGKFIEKFGTGFFDVSANLTFELL